MNNYNQTQAGYSAPGARDDVPTKGHAGRNLKRELTSTLIINQLTGPAFLFLSLLSPLFPVASDQSIFINPHYKLHLTSFDHSIVLPLSKGKLAGAIMSHAKHLKVIPPSFHSPWHMNCDQIYCLSANMEAKVRASHSLSSMPYSATHKITKHWSVSKAFK